MFRVKRFQRNMILCHKTRTLFKNIKIEVNKIIILPAILRECETWSLTLRKECGLRVF
jgi:hypothetical protein